MNMHCIVFLLIALSTLHNFAQEPSKRTMIPMAPGASITICLNNNHDFSSQNSNLSSPAQTVTMPAAQESPVFNKIATLWHENTIKQQLHEGSSHFFNAYKWHLLALFTAGAYAGLVYIIASGNHYLSDNQLWSSWHQELPLDQLLAIPQQQLSQELLREIQRRYTDSESITNLVKPLGKFMIAVEQEEEQLKWYQNTYSWISYARLPHLVPLNKHRFTKINERLQRLAYYKNTFQSWAADYQLQVAERMRVRCDMQPYADFNEIAHMLQVEMNQIILYHWAQSQQCAIPTFG